jgi:hypothetical protein
VLGKVDGRADAAEACTNADHTEAAAVTDRVLDERRGAGLSRDAAGALGHGGTGGNLGGGEGGVGELDDHCCCCSCS